MIDVNSAEDVEYMLIDNGEEIVIGFNGIHFDIVSWIQDGIFLFDGIRNLVVKNIPDDIFARLVNQIHVLLVSFNASGDPDEHILLGRAIR